MCADHGSVPRPEVSPAGKVNDAAKRSLEYMVLEKRAPPLNQIKIDHGVISGVLHRRPDRGSAPPPLHPGKAEDQGTGCGLWSYPFGLVRAQAEEEGWADLY